MRICYAEIIDQDHDHRYSLPDTYCLFIEPSNFQAGGLGSTIHALNLKLKTDDIGSVLLGTFDTYIAAFNEIKNIMTCEDNFYIVNGYDR